MCSVCDSGHRLPPDPQTEKEQYEKARDDTWMRGNKAPSARVVFQLHLHQRKGIFTILIFSVRNLPGGYSGLLASYCHEVLIFSLLLTLEEERFLNLSRPVLPFLSPVKIDFSTPAHGVVKNRCWHICISMYLSDRTICPCWGGCRAGFCLSIFLASMGSNNRTSEFHANSTG